MAKICSRCKKDKPLSEFYKNKTHKDGYNTVCKRCYTEVEREHWKLEKTKKTRKVWKLKNKDKMKDYFRKREYKNKYGKTIEDWQVLFDEQKGCCVICGRHQSELKHRLHFDHDHKTGKICGLLCKRCNLLAGSIENNLNLINPILEYLGVCSE